MISATIAAGRTKFSAAPSRRGTVVDVTPSRRTPQLGRFSKMLAAAVPLPGHDRLLLAPEDMVLHSATHLFLKAIGCGIERSADIDSLISHLRRRRGF